MGDLMHLNASQRDAAMDFLRGPRKLFLMQGPPGTGKSHTISALIRALVSKGVAKGRLILVCATSNKAVQGLLGRFLLETKGFKVNVALAGVEDQLPDGPDQDFLGDDAPDICAWDVFLHKPVYAALIRLGGMCTRMKTLGSREVVSRALAQLIERLSAGS